jgi:conjugal transfer ATP-binding protein TraC
MLTFLEKLMVDPSRDIGGRLASEQFSLMEKALNQLILKSNGKEFFLHDFKEVIGNPSFPGGDKLAMRLSPWCRGQGGMPSRFGNLFDGPTQIDLSNPFTVFDLTKIKDNPELGGVMFSTILRQVSLVGALFPGRQKFLVFDECWSFLQDPVVAQFVVYAYRALRKVGFSTIGISQGIEEFQKTSNRDAIIGNIAHLLILRQNSTQSAQGLGEQFQLTETETNIITKLKTEKGHFSQCLVSQVLSDGRRQSVLTLNRPSALSYWTSTTHAPDKGIIAKYRDEGMGYLDALVRLSKEYPHGVEGGKADLAKAA